MTENVEDYLLSMSSHLPKLNKYRLAAETRQERQADGKIEINSLTSTVRSHVYNLANKIDYNR